jgi:hypothetical protein
VALKRGGKMSVDKKNLRMWGLAGVLLCALLIAWGIESKGKKTSVVLAQQETWATPEALRLGVRLLA